MTVATSKQDTDEQFEFLEESGSGLYGVVWKARDCALNRIVAIKLVHPSMASVYNVIEHAQALVRAGEHPNLVRVIAAVRLCRPGTDVLTDAVVMEWLEGDLLSTRLSRGGLAREEALTAR